MDSSSGDSMHDLALVGQHKPHHSSLGLAVHVTEKEHVSVYKVINTLKLKEDLPPNNLQKWFPLVLVHPEAHKQTILLPKCDHSLC